MELPRSLAVTLVLLLAGGCTVISLVALRHQQTGDTVRCEEYWYWNIFPREAQEENGSASAAWRITNGRAMCGCLSKPLSVRPMRRGS